MGGPGPMGGKGGPMNQQQQMMRQQQMMMMQQQGMQMQLQAVQWCWEKKLYVPGMEQWDDWTWAQWQMTLVFQGQWDLEDWGDWYGISADWGPDQWKEYKAIRSQQGEKNYSDWKPPGGFNENKEPLDKDGKVIALDENGIPTDQEMWKIWAEQMGWFDEEGGADGKEEGADGKKKKKKEMTLEEFEAIKKKKMEDKEAAKAKR